MSNRERIIEAIHEIYAKYEQNPYMEQKVVNYVCLQLPLIFENIERTHIERSQRTDELTAEQNVFIQHFLYNNRYFYHPSTEAFFYYNGDYYRQYGEDDILFNVLSSISRDANLMQWKHKTKTTIMKRIKDNHLYKAIPESGTIQAVLNLFCPAIFKTKTEAKYFLTILGENIVGKARSAQHDRSATEARSTQCDRSAQHDRSAHLSDDDQLPTSLIHIVPASAKQFIHRLNTLCQSWFGSNLSQTFKYKYHADHSYSSIRIFNFNGVVDSESFDAGFNDRGLNILCVACHYANRYTNSDNYLLKYSNDADLVNAVFFLKNISPDTLVDMFIGEYISASPVETKVSSSVDTKVLDTKVSSTVDTKVLDTKVLDTKVSSSSVDTKVPLVDIKISSSVDTKVSSVDIKISWKNMVYLWRHFLEAKRLPNVIVTAKLKTYLTTRLADYYNMDVDAFIGINSKYLPSVCKFLQFWEDTMEPDETELELEISEVAVLFKKWTESRRESANQFHEKQLSEKQICDLILYFYPEVEIEGEKYIYKIKNKMWDKQLDIQMAMEDLKDRLGCEGWRQVIEHVSLYDAYVHYSNYMNGALAKGEEGKRRRPSSGNLAAIRIIVSKQYFDRFMTF